MHSPDSYFVWPYAKSLLHEVYVFVRTLPGSERFNLVSQMRRSAASVRNNICEGCSRQGDRAMLPFLYTAHASAAELYDQFCQCRELELGDQTMAKATGRKAGRLHLMLNRLIKQKEARLEINPRRRRSPRRTR